jgi:hypothetical protein
MSSKRKVKHKYPSPEVYDHVRFSKTKKKVSLIKDKKIWYLAIALVALMVTLLAIITR